MANILGVAGATLVSLQAIGATAGNMTWSNYGLFCFFQVGMPSEDKDLAKPFSSIRLQVNGILFFNFANNL